MTDLDAIYRDALTTRLLRRMSHAIEHDLKSPVQGIYWSLELALKGVAAENVDAKTRAQVEKAVAMARKELVRLERTSRTFLADAGIADAGEERFDIVDLAKETVRHFVTDAAMRNVRLTVDVPPEPIYVRAPRSEIAQAVLTCLLHSLDSVADGGLSEVFVRRENGLVVIEVADDANGAPEAERRVRPRHARHAHREGPRGGARRRVLQKGRGQRQAPHDLREAADRDGILTRAQRASSSLARRAASTGFTT